MPDKIMAVARRPPTGSNVLRQSILLHLFGDGVGIDWHLTFVVVTGEAMRADGPILPTKLFCGPQHHLKICKNYFMGHSITSKYAKSANLF
jgi:hypothetical protein